MERIKLVLAIVKAVASIGVPPSVDDQAALRAWCKNLLDLLGTIAEFIPSEVDDTIVAILDAAVEDDATWAAFYRLFASEAEGKLMATHEDAPTVAEAAAVNPVVIFEAIMLIVKLWKEWKK